MHSVSSARGVIINHNISGEGGERKLEAEKYEKRSTRTLCHA